ncbi:phospholipase A2-like [Onychomys torridus]|uniref:phospholipase A2-like n=1 Tax=Onychomys torridus TaxID=38674 RepID=UPI00167F640A|nr:phospholipase A2-like [Onychomys torridus]
MTEYSLYGCYCDYATRTNVLADLDRCCQIRDNCHNHVKKLENCKSLIDNLNIFYSYSCSGNEVTCRGRNNTCENLICNCDRQAAICFSQAPNNKGNKEENNACEAFVCNCDRQVAICFSKQDNDMRC